MGKETLEETVYLEEEDYDCKLGNLAGDAVQRSTKICERSGECALTAVCTTDETTGDDPGFLGINRRWTTAVGITCDSCRDPKNFGAAVSDVQALDSI